MQNNIPLWFQTRQYSSFDTGHVNSVIPAGFSKWSCFHADISLGAVFAYVNNAFGNWTVHSVSSWCLHGSFHHHTQLFLKRPVGHWKVFPLFSITELILDHSLPPVSAAHPHPIPHMHSCKRAAWRIIIMQKLEKNCNASTQREQRDCSFTEEQEKRREIPLYRLRHVTVIWICTQLHVNGNNSGIFISVCPLFFFRIKGKNRTICVHVNILIEIKSPALLLCFLHALG